MMNLYLNSVIIIFSGDWKQNTEYSFGYDRYSSIIRWFWKVVESFPQELQVKLVQFVTGL